MVINVFLADDHAIVREGLKLLLEEQTDITVVGMAGDGRDAVSQIRKLRPDVAVIDITMPELNGIEATQQICEICPSTRVIILSMHVAKEQVFRALEAGARGYVLKETVSTDVIQAIRTVNSGRRYMSEIISDIIIDDLMSHLKQEERKDTLSILSSREREIFQLIVEGKSSRDVADLLCLSPKTVNTYRYRMMEKLGIDNLSELVRFAIQNGLSPLK